MKSRTLTTFTTLSAIFLAGCATTPYPSGLGKYMPAGEEPTVQYDKKQKQAIIESKIDEKYNRRITINNFKQPDEYFIEEIYPNSPQQPFNPKNMQGKLDEAEPEMPSLKTTK